MDSAQGPCAFPHLPTLVRQAYLLSKQQPIPLDVEFDVQDVLHHLRPRLVRYGSYEEALAAVTELLSAEAAAGAAAGVLGAIDEGVGDGVGRLSEAV